MARAESARIHPTAIIPPDADLGEDVEIGPYAVLEGPVTIGTGCVIRAHTHLIGPLTLGSNNKVFTGVVIGEQPQHIKYNGEPTRVEIGDNNIFRENVTIHRGTTATHLTRIGNNNFLMAGAHIAHDCVVGNNCILANGALVAGHCVLEDNVFLSGNSALHQFVRVGRLALLSGVSASTKDIPPFIMQQRINVVVGLNLVGMRRAGIPTAHIDGVRQAFHYIYREDSTLPVALAKCEHQFGTVPEVVELVQFIRAPGRGICTNLCRDAA
jgi:UDP-N-acetylglucosamine acyltransferase